MIANPTALEALRAATRRLTDAGIPDAPRDGRALLAYAMGIAADRLTLHLPDTLTDAAVASYESAIAARLHRQPVAQIIGHRLFWGRSFMVTQDTLDPRPETEILVAEALKRPFKTMLDLGTGTGCILLSCLADRPDAQGIGTDISARALAVAQANATALHIADRARFVQSDWFAAIPGSFDLITSNPPYITADEMAQLAPDVLQWEPHLALTPGGDGLDAYRAIAANALPHLAAGGRFLLEIGRTQASAVLALLAAEGFCNLRVLADFDGRDRVVVAENPGQ
jgi:release factor glutamine methyltransferase